MVSGKTTADEDSRSAFKALVVVLVLNGKIDDALGLLAKHYNVDPPKIKVGLPKGRRKNVLGCYTANNRTISVLNSDALREPSIILHEFYHHLRRAADLKQRGTEDNADRFAREFIKATETFLRTNR